MVQKGKLGPCLVLYVLLTFISLVFLTARRFVVGAEMGGSFMCPCLPSLSVALSVCLARTRTHTHAHARAHTHTHVRARTHTHTDAHTGSSTFGHHRDRAREVKARSIVPRAHCAAARHTNRR